MNPYAKGLWVTHHLLPFFPNVHNHEAVYFMKISDNKIRKYSNSLLTFIMPTVSAIIARALDVSLRSSSQSSSASSIVITDGSLSISLMMGTGDGAGDGVGDRDMGISTCGGGDGDGEKVKSGRISMGEFCFMIGIIDCEVKLAQTDVLTRVGDGLRGLQDSTSMGDNERKDSAGDGTGDGTGDGMCSGGGVGEGTKGSGDGSMTIGEGG